MAGETETFRLIPVSADSFTVQVPSGISEYRNGTCRKYPQYQYPDPEEDFFSYVPVTDPPPCMQVCCHAGAPLRDVSFTKSKRGPASDLYEAGPHIVFCSRKPFPMPSEGETVCFGFRIRSSVKPKEPFSRS